jgi:uncharacterized protein (TIGR04141 family)
VPANQKIKPAIYQIDLDRVHNLTDNLTDETELNPRNVDQHILRYHEWQRQQGLSGAKQYHLRLENVSFDGFSVTVYGTQDSHPHPWTELFGQTISDLFVSYPNLVAFIANDEVCYVISAGQGHTLFEQFVDRQFALEVAKRIMTPEVSATRRREISGAIYGQMQQYRTSQRIASSQTLGTVWSGLSGVVTKEVRATRDFIEIFQPGTGDIGVEAGSSLLIKKSIEVTKLPKLIIWIEKLLQTDLTTQQEADFSFMNGLTQIARRDKSQKEALALALATNIHAQLSSIDEIDLDFSHKNFPAYQEAHSYDFGRTPELRVINYDTPPAASRVLGDLRDNTALGSCQSGSEVLEVLRDIRFFANQTPPLSPLNAAIFDYLHGEILLGGEHFFLVDGAWYRASGDFLTRLRADFKKVHSGPHFDASDLGMSLDPCSDPTEGEYNLSYQDREKWIVADRAFIERVELADLIHWDGEKLYIVHNKVGYGASTRDVCSQILLSMNLLNRITPAQLREYYATIAETNYTAGQELPLTEDEFVRLLSGTAKNNIVYVLGYIRRTPVTTAPSGSSIAKYETVKLCEEDSPLFGYGLKIVHIQKS